MHGPPAAHAARLEIALSGAAPRDALACGRVAAARRARGVGDPRGVPALPRRLARRAQRREGGVRRDAQRVVQHALGLVSRARAAGRRSRTPGSRAHYPLGDGDRCPSTISTARSPPSPPSSATTRAALRRRARACRRDVRRRARARTPARRCGLLPSMGPRVVRRRLPRAVSTRRLRVAGAALPRRPPRARLRRLLLRGHRVLRRRLRARAPPRCRRPTTTTACAPPRAFFARPRVRRRLGVLGRRRAIAITAPARRADARGARRRRPLRQSRRREPRAGGAPSARGRGLRRPRSRRTRSSASPQGDAGLAAHGRRARASTSRSARASARRRVGSRAGGSMAADPATGPGRALGARAARSGRAVHDRRASWDATGRDVTFEGEVFALAQAHRMVSLRRPAAHDRPALLRRDGRREPCPTISSRSQAAGWEVVDPLEVSRDPHVYRAFIRRSRGEFTVAKDVNVRLRSGWFSDRSACYLAAGRPVVNQDTGFDEHLPTGNGLFTFRSPRRTPRRRSRPSPPTTPTIVAPPVRSPSSTSPRRACSRRSSARRADRPMRSVGTR